MALSETCRPHRAEPLFTMWAFEVQQQKKKIKRVLLFCVWDFPPFLLFSWTMRYNQLDTQIRGDLISPLAQLKQDHHLQGMCWLDTTDWPVSSITMGVQMQPSLHRQGMAPSFQSAANSFTVLKSGILECLTLAALVFRQRLWPVLPPLLREGNDLQTSHASPIHTEQMPCTECQALKGREEKHLKIH